MVDLEPAEPRATALLSLEIMVDGVSAASETGVPRLRRRTWEQVHDLLLNSARSIFARKGFAGASTREIALEAGVSEALLFRHFGSKAKLFEHAVLDPLNEFMRSYVETWMARSVVDHTSDAVTRGFVDGLYGLLTEHRDLVLALIAAQAYDSLEDLTVASPLNRLMEELELLAGKEAGDRGYDFDVPVATRVATSMIIGMALLDDWLFPPSRRRPSRRRIVDEMAAFVVHGLSHRTEGPNAVVTEGELSF